ncbi:hypothetical protein, partial [Holospora obtusa]|uniref:hypothetical protein n=1 Tax=Holospora obtusa TaxID=49893 RepID=UPI00138AD47F
DLSNSRYKYQEDPVSFFVLKNLRTKNMIISSKNQLLLRNISKLFEAWVKSYGIRTWANWIMLHFIDHKERKS